VMSHRPKIRLTNEALDVSASCKAVTSETFGSHHTASVL
jgi:hypothetical protein